MNNLRKIFVPTLVSIIFISIASTHSWSKEVDSSIWTAPLNDNTKATFTLDQLKKGKRLFNNSCSVCHAGGITKTNPNVSLDSESLMRATPSRNSVESLINYMKDPTTFDGTKSIAEFHPSVKSADIFPKMRSLTEEDLYAIAGHILIQPEIVSEKWGGGKIYF